MHCRDCRFSEGVPEMREGRLTLVLWCLAKGARALEVCGNFAPTEAAP